MEERSFIIYLLFFAMRTSVAQRSFLETFENSVTE